MLTIRDAAWDKLAEAAHADFVKWMRAHLREFLAEECKAFDDIKLSELIEFGIKRAKRHGFEFESEICKYIDLMCVFGPRFDEDEKLPWAQEILESDLLLDPGERMRRLHNTAVEALQQMSNG
jgi:hypothetical protein